jgi:hypothetical protein
MQELEKPGNAKMKKTREKRGTALRTKTSEDKMGFEKLPKPDREGLEIIILKFQMQKLQTLIFLC